VPEACWSSHRGHDCLRVHGAVAAGRLEVYPASALASPGAPPTTEGRVAVDGADLCFVPRFGFVDGTVYAVVVDGERLADLARPRAGRPSTAEVVGITPGTLRVPRNLLRVHVWFSAPMSEGQAASCLRLVDDDGGVLPHALLAVDDELWDADRRRLTVLLDPARIKRGLVAQRTLGYPLQTGRAFRVVVDEGFLDALGAPLRQGASRRYEVGADERRPVDPHAWTVRCPRTGTTDALRVGFDRTLDVALVPRCLTVHRAAERLAGRNEVAPDGGSWTFVPSRPWSAGPHALAVDDRLEDLAGNSVRRPFDRDLTDDPPERTPAAGPVTVGFAPAS
jgi:hypothetical protein